MLFTFNLPTTPKNYTPGDEPHSVWIPKNVGGKTVRVYQKGFDGNEWIDYVSETLGEDFKIEKVIGFGKSGVIVTRLTNSVDSITKTKKDADITKNINQGKKAIEEIIKNHNDVSSAMHRDDIGDIDFLWGKEGDPNRNYKKGYGIAHIIARRNLQGMDGEQFALLMLEVIMRGEKEVSTSGVKINLTRCEGKNKKRQKMLSFM